MYYVAQIIFTPFQPAMVFLARMAGRYGPYLFFIVERDEQRLLYDDVRYMIAINPEMQKPEKISDVLNLELNNMQTDKIIAVDYDLISEELLRNLVEQASKSGCRLRAVPIDTFELFEISSVNNISNMLKNSKIEVVAIGSESEKMFRAFHAY